MTSLLRPPECRLMQVLLSLTDNWQQTGGADDMVRWVGGGLTHEDFFTDTRVKVAGHWGQCKLAAHLWAAPAALSMPPTELQQGLAC